MDGRDTEELCVAVVPQQNIKTFAATVSFLSKVGNELFIEAETDCLVLRALNDAQSAFAAVYLRPEHDSQGASGFFDAYSRPPRTIKCKLATKLLRIIFRSTKRVTEMRISFERERSGAKSHSIVFRMGCHGHMTKTHRFSVEECQILQAVFDKTQAPNNITTRVRQLSRVVEHIQGTEDLYIAAAHNRVRVKSWHDSMGHVSAHGSVEDADMSCNHTSTALTIQPEEFEGYSFGLASHDGGDNDGEVELVFSRKEVKAILSFCSSVFTDLCGDGPSVNLYYSANGQPILMSTDATPTEAFEATLVMATMTINDVRDGTDDANGPMQSNASNMSANSGHGDGRMQNASPPVATPAQPDFEQSQISQTPFRALDTPGLNQHIDASITSELDASTTIVPATANTQMDSDVDASIAHKHVESNALSASAVDDSQVAWSASPSNAQGKRQRRA
eukprot:g2309.t1